MTGKEICELCGKPDANVAYFKTGMAAVTFRHHECDRRRESSPSEERQEWGIDQWLKSF